MTDDGIDNLSFVLGGIKNSVDTVIKTQGEDREASARYRTDIRKEVKDLGEKIDKAISAATRANDRLGEIEPTVKTLAEGALMSKGAQRFAVMLGKAGHLLVAALASILTLVADRWMHK